MRRIGVLMNTTASPEQQTNFTAFQQALQQLGWTDGRNVRINIRWAEGDPRKIRKHAGELVALAPDVIVATGNAGMTPLLQATRTVPIVFNNIADPVGGGFVKSMGDRAATPPASFSSIQVEREMAGDPQGIEPRLTRLAVRPSCGRASSSSFALDPGRRD